MRERLGKTALVATVLVFLLGFLVVTEVTSSPLVDYAQIDAFTQKEPFSGKGKNMSSEAFGPQEHVILYALVSSDNYTIDNILVAFEVETPNHLTFSISSRTNSSGIAKVNFTMATVPINLSESDVFGYWNVIATVLYAGQVSSDTLTFRVDWIVKLLTVKTIDGNQSYQGYFGNGGDVGFEITLRSIARTLRNTTISVVVQDELGFIVNSSLVRDFAVQPNEKLLFIFFKATLPKAAHVGFAKVFVSAFTAPVDEGGVPSCPAVSADFYIQSGNPLSIDLHDVAVVAVIPTANPLRFGQNLNLTTLVRNEGTVAENFNVTTYFDGLPLGTATIVALLPYSTMSFSYYVGLSVLSVGNHTVEATIPPIAHEADLTDNNFADIVEVTSEAPQAVHDIAITKITTSKTAVFVGEMLTINVTVYNKQTQSENFDLSLFFNSSLVETQQDINLTPLTETTLIFYWEASTVGVYQISAFAPLPQDINPADNSLVDGTVEVKPLTPPQDVHDVAVTNVTPTPTEVIVGGIITIRVRAENLGNVTESFNVTVYYDSVLLNKQLVIELAPSTEKELIFEWNTNGVSPGSYIIRAAADVVPGEINVENNVFVDGAVTVLATPVQPIPLAWMIIIFLLLLALMAGAGLLFILCFADRLRRKKRSRRYAVIVHPHI